VPFGFVKSVGELTMCHVPSSSGANRPWAFTWGGFFVRRFVRLFPPLLTLALFTCLVLSVSADMIGPH